LVDRTSGSPSVCLFVYNACIAAKRYIVRDRRRYS